MSERQEPNTTPQQPQRRKRRRRRRFHPIAFLLKAIGTVLLVAVTTGVLLACFASVYINTAILPDVRDWITTLSGDVDVGLTSTMYYTDENGVDREYLTLSSDENRVWVKYDDIPTDLLKATVATEDKRFYDHNGVDWIRTARGVLNMFTGGSVQGGSTLTQQLIKNITGENQTTVKRKITEIFRALEFDKNYSKETTLEWYLNYIFYGERCYGFSTASYMYFGKPANQLSLAECACLISIPNNPSRYDPYLNKSAEVTNDEALRKRAKNTVLWSMCDQGMISEEEYAKACGEVDDIVFQRGSDETTANITIYNWYQDQVLADVIKDLMTTYGWSERVAANKVYYGGLSIYTNVDPKIQNILEEFYANTENLPYISNSGQPMQSGMTIIENTTGKVVAVAGGIGEKTVNRAWSRASDTVRPTGSSIKPLSVYAPAFEFNLLNANSIVDDSPYMYIGEDTPWPVNAYGFYGGLTGLPFGLAQSSNAMAVRVLGDLVTPEASFRFMQEQFHISSLVREKWINGEKYSDILLPPLALGGLTDGISTYEMAAAYATFPNMGYYVPPRTYSKVIDADGKTVLLDMANKGEYVLKESTAYHINTLLRYVVTNGTGYSAAFPGMTVAGKTGTTSSEKDLWFVGYTPYYTGAVWVGYDRQERMKGVGYPTNAIFKKVMGQIHEGLENKDFPLPTGAEFVTAEYCRDSGLKPNEFCEIDVRGSRVATGTYLKGEEPTQTCTMHIGIDVCIEDVVKKEPDEEGKGGGELVLRLAGPHCPVDTVKTIGVLDFKREGASGDRPTRDMGALYYNWEDTEPCTFHTGSGDPNAADFDPRDPHTWPLDDPDFDINDPSTWPVPPEEIEGYTPIGGDVAPPPDEDDGPVEDEPYVPAGHT